ncbi:MAG TPA: ATP-binding protein [bacterium]|nr:ATP-binding protein [bacterium]
MKPTSLRWRCKPTCFGFKTTKNAKPLDGVLGQARAVKAIEVGLNIDSPGYNIYVAGLSGTGKMTTVKALLGKLEKASEPPSDIIYVNNFADRQKPRCIKLPAGKGSMLKKDMEELVEYLKKVIPNIFENQEYKDQRDAIIENYRELQKEHFRQLENTIKNENFAMVQVQMGPFTRPMILPLIESQPVQFEQLESLAADGNFPPEKLTQLKEQHAVLRNGLETTMKKVRQIEKEMKEALNKLEHDYGIQIIADLLTDIREKHKSKEVNAYLDEVLDAVLGDMSRFKEKDDQPQAAPMMMMEMPTKDEFTDFMVNVAVDNSKTKKRPVVIENTPSYKNLFGFIEKTIAKNGSWATDFTKIHAGSILQADGGILVINLLDAISESGVWKNLKRMLKTRQLEIEGWDAFYWMMISSIKPEPAPVNVKIVAIGEDWLFHYLHYYDEDFKKIFKIKADFDYEMKKDEEMIVRYSSFLHKIVTDEKLLHLTNKGVSALVEEGVRMTGKQKKLSTRFSILADIVREANYWAEKDKKKLIDEKHIMQALQSRRERLSLYEDKLQEMIEEGKLLITSSGGTTGQVNGLAVYSIGEYAFGKPSRITAEVSLGQGHIVNIERESKLSGKIHDKGMLILSGYLRGKYSQNKPMSIQASICFEQSYGGIDGDSASSTEMYALLSALSGLPIEQGIAVTGSVNQKGEIQPIGGVNEKIEGFFEVCKARGLDGKQGVMIPHTNVDDLMLREEIVTAVKNRKFNVWAVKTIDEGIALLTGVPAGKKKDDGTYPKGTINCLVDARLDEMARALRKFGRERDGEKRIERIGENAKKNPDPGDKKVNGKKRAPAGKGGKKSRK